MRNRYDTNLSLEEIRSLLNKEELEDEPVELHRFVTDPYFLGLKPLSPVQTMIVERMTQVFFPPTLEKLYGKEEADRIWNETVNEVICQIGKGGGKDWSLRIAFARIIYLLHCLKDPLDYYGIGHGEYIDLLNIALNSDQAQRIFFDPLKNLLIASPYFQKRGFIAMSKKIEFMERPIRCFSGHSEAEGWEGYNLIAVTLDEISAFKIQEESTSKESKYHSAKAIYDMARLSVISRFPQVGKVALLSFPRFEADFIQQRYEGVIAKKVTRKVERNLGPITIWWEDDEIIEYREPKVWAVKCPTFVSNPTKRPEDFLSDFIRDPVNSNARILCRPPKTSEAYFRDPDRVRSCFHQHDESCPMGESCPERPPFDESGRLLTTFRDPDGPPRFIHIDLGLNRDRSALCMVHCSGFHRSMADGQIMPVIKMDVIKYWEAPPDGEVDFNDVRRFVFSLADRFNVAMVTIDRWNSIDSRNIFLSRGIYTEFMNVKKDHYDTLSTCIHDKRLIAYYHPILVEDELLKLQLLRGTKVDHPKTGYKDGSDALAGAVYSCTENTPVEEVVVDIDILGLDEKRPESEVSSKQKTEIDERADETGGPEMPDDIKEFLSGMGLI